MLRRADRDRRRCVAGVRGRGYCKGGGRARWLPSHHQRRMRISIVHERSGIGVVARWGLGRGSIAGLIGTAQSSPLRVNVEWPRTAPCSTSACSAARPHPRWRLCRRASESRGLGASRVAESTSVLASSAVRACAQSRGRRLDCDDGWTSGLFVACSPTRCYRPRLCSCSTCVRSESFPKLSIRLCRLNLAFRRVFRSDDMNCFRVARRSLRMHDVKRRLALIVIPSR